MSNRFPRGKLCDDDEGELEISIGIEDATIIVKFGKPIHWVGLSANDALACPHTCCEG